MLPPKGKSNLKGHLKIHFTAYVLVFCLINFPTDYNSPKESDLPRFKDGLLWRTEYFGQTVNDDEKQ